MKIRLLFLKTFLLATVLLFPFSFAFFDSKKIETTEIFQIGEWDWEWEKNEKITPKRLVDFLSKTDTVIITKTDSKQIDIKEYLLTIFFETRYSKPDITKIREPFRNYSFYEMIETIDTIKQSAENFLVFKHGKAIFPKPSSVGYRRLNVNNLAVGETQIFREFILTANQASSRSWRDSILLSITIETEKEIDLSEFSIEILIDTAGFHKNPFDYGYLLDGNSIQDASAVAYIPDQLNCPIPVFEPISYYTYRYDSCQDIMVFRHCLKPPSFTGTWCRFPFGPNYAEKDGEYVLFPPFLRPGIILCGKKNGSKAEMRISICDRKFPSEDLPAIPILLYLSRGKNNSVQEDSDSFLIKYRITEGCIWD